MLPNIQVDVSGEHLFFVDKDILADYSNRVRELIPKLSNNAKLVLDDFPGGAESFELITRFCYNNGTIHLTPSNIFLLHSASLFMEITTLINQTQSYLEGVHCWTWSDFLDGLKQCQVLFPFFNNSPVFQDFLNTLLGNLTISGYESSSCPSSSNSSSVRFSFIDNSPKGSRFDTHVDYGKFDDLAFLSVDLFDKLIRLMISLGFDHPMICSFIFCYQKSKFSLSSSLDQKCQISETNINLLSLVNSSAFSCKELLDAFGTSFFLNLGRNKRSRLENFLGARLDKLSIDDLLIRGKKKVAYDVEFVLRLTKSFLLERRIKGNFVHRLKKVGFLMDSFMLEVAPDPLLKPSKFLALATALPYYSRESHEKLYNAIELYLEVHRGLCEEQMTTLCNVVDFNKLSVVTNKLNVVGNGNSMLLSYVKQNQFKSDVNTGFRVNTTKNFRLVEKVKKDVTKFLSKKSRILDPCNAKSLPRLCH